MVGIWIPSFQKDKEIIPEFLYLCKYCLAENRWQTIAFSVFSAKDDRFSVSFFQIYGKMTLPE